MKLSFVRVQTWAHALDLLKVRNECREGLTHHTEEITKEQQLKFFMENIVKDSPFEVYLLYDGADINYDWARHNLIPAGYGLLKRDGNKKWMTAGVASAYRGRGLSRLLINLITEIAYADPGIEVWIDVADDNLALIGDIKAGYRFMEEHDGLHIMRHERDRPLLSAERRWLERRKKRDEILEVDAISREAYRR